MELKDKIFSLKGKTQNYAWGGYSYLYNLLGITNTGNKPMAEYWMGAHSSAPSIILNGEEEIKLDELIKQLPDITLTNKVYNVFGELPYLFKILDVHDMLSIQVHPSKIEAEKGFDAENAAGIPLNATNRNYKDRNHKPEVMVALSEFWLLHGFKSESLIETTLQDVHEFNILLGLFKSEGYKGLYQFVMEMRQEDVDTILIPLVQREIRRKQNEELSKHDAGWWVCKLYENQEKLINIDRGVFSIYFFNIVKANIGEAVFQGAGVPHAYLEGQNVELMANSDNVLRGGLTPKHIDVPELMKHTLFQPVIPNVMKGESIGNNETLFPCPVPDFGIKKITLDEKAIANSTSESLEIMILIQGDALVTSQDKAIDLKKGDAIMVLPNAHYSITTRSNALLFKAFVP